MLVELKLVEQRYRAVIDVLDGMSVTDVARRNKVSRQTVHTWLRRYADGGMAALADKSSKPESCPHQMAPVIEARVVEMRRAHPRWGPRSIRTHLAQEGFTPVPVARRSIAPWCAITCSSRPRASERARLQALGAQPFHGAVADGRRRTLPSGRWHRGQGHHRHRRPLTVLRLCPGGGPGDGETGVRSPAVGPSHPRGARPDPHRQRQGLHQAFRPGARARAVRPDLRQQRHPTHPHGSVLADDDRQGRALPQNHALGLLGRPRPGARQSSSNSKRPSTNGSTSTTRSGRTSRSAIARPSNVSLWPPAHRAADLEMPEMPDEVPLSSVRPASTVGSTSGARSGSEACAIGSGATFAGESVEVVVRPGSSRSSTPAWSSPPTPNDAGLTKGPLRNGPHALGRRVRRRAA